jgi:hypothetical protein
VISFGYGKSLLDGGWIIAYFGGVEGALAGIGWERGVIEGLVEVLALSWVGVDRHRSQIYLAFPFLLHSAGPHLASLPSMLHDRCTKTA